VADYDDLSCALNSREGVEDERRLVEGFATNESRLLAPVSAVRPEEFLCTYETHCFALCMCCDFFACDCRMKCSEGCDCYHDQTWSRNVIQCGQREHAAVPEFIPMDATHIYLDGNKLGDLSDETLIGRKHLRALFLNASHITSVSNKTLDGLAELEILHMEDNRLEELLSGVFASLTNLRELYLHDNLLSSLSASALAPLASLRTLSLHGNRLRDFPIWTLSSHARLLRLTLANNQWSCECDFLRKAQSFLKGSGRGVITDAANLRCQVDGSGLTNAIGGSSCADVMAVSFRASSVDADDNSFGLIPPVSSSDVASIPSDDQTAFTGVLPVVAVVASAVIIVVSLIILAVAFRRPVSGW